MTPPWSANVLQAGLEVNALFPPVQGKVKCVLDVVCVFPSQVAASVSQDGQV